MSVYDPENRRWSDIDTTAHSDEYHGAGYSYTEHGGLLSFGGYGHYRAKNDIRKYDFVRGVWDTLNVTGDRFEPRSGIFTAAGFERGKILLAGGYGNESGRQEMGFRRYLDFWEFDSEALTLKKIADFGDEVPGFSFWNLIALPEERILYSLGRVDSGASPTGEIQVYEVRLEPPAITPVGHALEVHSALWQTRLGFDASMQRLILMISELPEGGDVVEVTLYSLDYPPLPATAPPPLWDRGTDRLWIGVLLAIFAMAAGIGLWTIGRRDRTSLRPRPRAVRAGPIEDAPLSVQVFGEYRVSIEGNEIAHTAWESEKARLLFLYLILKDGHGVPVDQVTLDFWPDATKKSATNSRNSAISRIRHTLGNVGADMIVRENRLLRLAGEEMIACDLHRFEHYLGKQNSSRDDLEKALEIYGESGLAPEVEAPWIGSIREHYHRKAVRSARKLAALYEQASTWGTLTRLGRQVLTWDALDDDGVRMVVKGLHRRGKPALAHEEYQKYVDHYSDEVGETYEIGFKQMVE